MALRCNLCSNRIAKNDTFFIYHLTFSSLAGAKIYHQSCAEVARTRGEVPADWDFELVEREPRREPADSGLYLSVEDLVSELSLCRDRNGRLIAHSRTEAKIIAERFIRFWTTTLNVENFVNQVLR